MGELETDYLVVGAGAGGLAFADTLVQHSDATVTIVDRRHAPGGHWNDAYPFIRLHQPSPTYGVDSRRLGNDALDTTGQEPGSYERATAAEVCDYFDRVLKEQLLPTGRVRFLGMTEHVGVQGGSHRLVSRLTGTTWEVTVNRRLVDARYLETRVPATHQPGYDVDPGVRHIPVHRLVEVDDAPRRYVVIGSGKTGMDAVTWLLGQGVEPDRIRWIRPRDTWMLDRAALQPLDQVASIMEGFSLDLQALATAESEQDLFDRLEDCGRLYRLDRSVTPTMYRCAITNTVER
jgi:cation diffusion facilitator CzcD-associated flavoprotein CzcO